MISMLTIFRLLAAMALAFAISQRAEARQWPLTIIESYRAAKTVGDFVKCDEGATAKTCDFYANAIREIKDERLPKMLIVNSNTLGLEKDGRRVTIALSERAHEYFVNSKPVRITRETTPGSLLKSIQAIFPRASRKSAFHVLVPSAWAAATPWESAVAARLVELVDKIKTCEQLITFVKDCRAYDPKSLKGAVQRTGVGTQAPKIAFPNPAQKEKILQARTRLYTQATELTDGLPYLIKDHGPNGRDEHLCKGKEHPGFTIPPSFAPDLQECKKKFEAAATLSKGDVEDLKIDDVVRVLRDATGEKNLRKEDIVGGPGGRAPGAR